MPIDITDQPRRVQYAISGTGPYDFDFEVLEQTDVAVYRDATLLALTASYTVTINADGTGAVTLISATGTTLTVLGARPYQRTTDYATGGDFKADTINYEFDSFQIQILQLDERVKRSLKVAATDTGAVNTEVPTDRASKFLAFDASGDPIASTGTGADAGLRGDIAATTEGLGSELVGHIGSTVNSVADTVRSALRARRRSVFDFFTAAQKADVRAGTGLVNVAARLNLAFAELGDTTALRGGGYDFPDGVYALEETVIADKKTISLLGRGHGSSASTGGSIMKWEGSAGIPMWQIRRSQMCEIKGFRFHGKGAALPSAAIDLNVAGGDSPVNNCMRLSHLWLGAYPGDAVSSNHFVDGLITSGTNIQDDQSVIDNFFITTFTGAGIKIANTQNVLWDIANGTINGGTATSKGVSIGSRHVMLRNIFFQTNLLVDIEITNDGEVEAIQCGSELAGRYVLAAAGGTFRAHRGYWQIGANALDDNIIDIALGGDVQLRNFNFTDGGYTIVPRIKMRGPVAHVSLDYTNIPVEPYDDFFDVTTTTAGDKRVVRLCHDHVSFFNEWIHGAAIGKNLNRTDHGGLQRITARAGETGILEGWTSDYATRFFRFGTDGLIWGDNVQTGPFYSEGTEIADPAAPAANKGRYYFRDNGSGKTQLCVRFPTGAVQVIATEP